MNAGLAKVEAAIFTLIANLWLLLEPGWVGLFVALCWYGLAAITYFARPRS